MLFLVKRNSSNKCHIGTAVLIRGRRLLTFLSQMRRLFKGGAYSGAALIRVNTVIYTHKRDHKHPCPFRSMLTACLGLVSISTYLYTTLLASSVAGSFVVRSVTSSIPIYSPIPLVKRKKTMITTIKYTVTENEPHQVNEFAQQLTVSIYMINLEVYH